MILNMVGGGGGITIPNGIEKEFTATSAISKGSLVELTTTGVDIPVFTQVASLSVSSGYSDVAILTENLILFGWSISKKATAQAAVRGSDGTWTLGTAVSIATWSTETSSYNAFRCVAMNDHTVAVLAGGSKYSSSMYFQGDFFIIILDISSDGTITVKAKQSIYSVPDNMEIREGSEIAVYTGYPEICSMNETTCAFIFPYTYSDDHGGVGVGSFTYVEDVLTIPSTYVNLVSNDGSDDYGKPISISKLNENACVVTYHGSTSSVYSGAAISVVGSAASKITTWNESSDYACYGYISENTCFTTTNGTTLRTGVWNGSKFTYTNAGCNVLTKNRPVGFFQAADNKWYCLHCNINEMSSTTLDVYAINLDAGAYSTTAISTIEYRGGDCRHGLMALCGLSAVVIAPVINTTTAKLATSRVDGVALSDSTAGGTVTVCTL